MLGPVRHDRKEATVLASMGLAIALIVLHGLWMESRMARERAHLAELVGDDYELSQLQTLFLFSRADTIYGGTNQIQRNIIAERALGMPKEPRG